MTGTRIYNIWKNMLYRGNPNCKIINLHKYYTDKNIIVCNEWKDFINFYNWSMENGYENNLTIDRINNNSNYEPDNCRWTTVKEQNRNKGSNHLININGETKTISQLAEEVGIHQQTMRYRINNWDIKDIMKPGRKQEEQSNEKYINWNKKDKKWMFSVCEDKKQKYIGSYEKLENAIKAKEDYFNKI
jgi:hypothetical protein